MIKMPAQLARKKLRDLLPVSLRTTIATIIGNNIAVDRQTDCRALRLEWKENPAVQVAPALASQIRIQAGDFKGGRCAVSAAALGLANTSAYKVWGLM